MTVQAFHRTCLTLAALLAVADLTGCSQRPPEPVVRQIPVAVPCVDRIPAPVALEHDLLGVDYPLDVLYAAALRDKLKLEGQVVELTAIVKGCALRPNP